MSHTPRILIVDDEEPIRKALRRTLGSEACEIFEANGAPEALKLLQTTPVEIIISDFLMPEVNGLDLLEQAHALLPDAVLIIMTGHAELDLVVQSISETAACLFLLKPWDPFDVRMMIRRVREHLEE